MLARVVVGVEECDLALTGSQKNWFARLFTTEPPCWAYYVSFKKMYFYCIHVSVLPACEIVQYMCAVPTETRREHWIPGTGARDGCEPSHGC